MNTLPIIVLTELARAPLPTSADTAVYINPSAIATWRPAAHPQGATELRLFGDSELGTIFVRESPERVFELVTGESLPSLSVDDIVLPQHALAYTGEQGYSRPTAGEFGWKAVCSCGHTEIEETERSAISSLYLHHIEPALHVQLDGIDAAYEAAAADLAPGRPLS